MKLFYTLAGLFLALAIGFGIDWQHDNAFLKAKAQEIVAGLRSPSQRIAAINHWVYSNQGFAKNPQYFLLKGLGPTPIQVLHAGGDCSDKSRLVSAMLAQIGIASGLVMISECADCVPIHTVVEAEQENGRMVVDPTWDVDYPSADGRYLSVRDLAGTARGWEHVLQLQKQRGPGAKVAYMPRSEATFDHTMAFNWRRNAITRIAAGVLRALGQDPGSLLRPRVLEDPKLFLTAACFALAVAAALCGLGASVWVRIRRRPTVSTG